MAEDTPEFLISAQDDPVLLKIKGRVSYLNCAPIGKLFGKLIAKGRGAFVVDFEDCSGMDSTFLGILAGVALEMHKMSPPGSFTVCKLNDRNYELVQNLGLHRIMTVAVGSECNLDESNIKEVPAAGIVSKEAMLSAHENLIKANKKNKDEFKDVIEFLKDQVEQG